MVSFLGFIISNGQLKADPVQIKAVTDWPAPTSRKKLQCFLGFVNFYWRVIFNYSCIVSPLTKLTSTITPFQWTPETNQAFTCLKQLFTSPSVLTHPDALLQFIVEVDKLDSVVGAVLSQRSSKDQKLHPCAFSSCRSSIAERNYDVGNLELLAVVLALQECRHCLEGAEKTFPCLDGP